jgi:hypothetical protein
MKALTVEQLIQILNRKPLGDVVFEGEIGRILEKHGADYFVIDGMLEKVNDAKMEG